MSDLRIEYMPLTAIERALRNPKRHNMEGITRSFGRFGFVELPVLNEATGRLVAGAGRCDALLAARADGKPAPARVQTREDDWYVPVLRGIAFADEAEAEAYLLASNYLTISGGWDDSELLTLLQALAPDPDLLAATGYTPEDITALLASVTPAAADGAAQARQTLAERFLVPPFSVLDTRQAYWLERKRAWLALGIQSELGRVGADRSERGLTYAVSAQSPTIYALRNRMRLASGRDPSWEEILREAQAQGYYLSSGTSIFDPVLCEVAYRWFCPSNGHVLDPFAGGSVRGIVAALTGRRYTGIDLRAEQVEANEAQWQAIGGEGPAPRWIVGDSREHIAHVAEPVDFLFTCPPYFDLEVYSDDPADLSRASDYPTFLAAYRTILDAACARLAANRFACIVVSEFRDAGSRGPLRNFVSDTIAIFQAAGLALWNHAALVNQAASAAIRAAEGFRVSRKLCRVHQYVLVFVKGDPREATAACGEVDVEFPVDAFTESDPTDAES